MREFKAAHVALLESGWNVLVEFRSPLIYMFLRAVTFWSAKLAKLRFNCIWRNLSSVNILPTQKVNPKTSSKVGRINFIAIQWISCLCLLLLLANSLCQSFVSVACPNCGLYCLRNFGIQSAVSIIGCGLNFNFRQTPCGELITGHKFLMSYNLINY